MFAEGETELRDLIVQNLETCGFLSKIKAELRAGVILALSEEGNIRKKVPLFHKKLDHFIDTNNGKLAVSVIREFLEYFNLSFTLSVFDPEIASSDSCFDRADLCKQLNLNESGFDGPVLSELLKNNQQDANKMHLPTDSRQSISEDNASTIKKTENLESAMDSFSQQITKSSKLVGCDEDITSAELTVENKFFKSSSLTFDKPRSDIFDEDKSEKSLFKESALSPDPFFDEPVPSEKSSFLNLNAGNDKNKSSTPTGDLSFLRDLPSLLTRPDQKAQESSLHSFVAENLNHEKRESNEEFSDKQMNSEDSIEEEIEEDFSAGIDELNSLSLGDDATSDQTVSQTSVVEGVDHIEST